MGKVVSSYASVVRGVSEQVPQDRHPGQHYEQINMVSDPKTGTARRYGSRSIGEMKLLAGTLLTSNMKETIRTYREQTFFIDGVEYSAIYRGDATTTPDILPLLFIYNKDQARFVNVVLESGAGLAPYLTAGLSSMASVGEFVIGSCNGALPSYTQTDLYANTASQGDLWIRGGAYSRTYTATIFMANGTVVTKSYTTPSSSYPNLLDTSGIPSESPPGTPNPNYQKDVNDLVNAYNSAATQWIGTSYAAQQPANIALQLAGELAAVVGPIFGVDPGQSHIYWGTDLISDGQIDDGGDGTLVRACVHSITAPENVTSQHFGNKVIQVKAPGQLDAYYLKAVRANNATGFGPVTWIESPGTLIQPTAVFAIGRFSSDGNTFYFAHTPAALDTLATTTDSPPFLPSTAGDIDAVGAKPYFLDHQINHMTTFQDRLTIVSNGVIFMSKTGDYFNWFRGSALAVDDSDPCEMYALGSEDDIITRSIPYNQSLFLFGLRNQYAISGRSPITPQTSIVSAAASERNANFARPAVSGNLLYYGRSKSKRYLTPSPYVGAVAQFQLGIFQDTPETYAASSQLNNYIQGRPCELTTLVEPTTLFVRTDGNDNGLYVYSFIDDPNTQAREFDSWGRWEWDINNVGMVAGIVTYNVALIVFTLKSDGTNMWIGAEEFVMNAELGDTGHHDSWRPYADYTAGAGFLSPTYNTGATVVLDSTSPRFLLGTTIDKLSDFMSQLPGQVEASGTFGYPMDSSVQITPPYLRDQNDRAIVSGQLTVTQYNISLTDTGGLDAYVARNSAAAIAVKKYNGRVLGKSNNLVGYQPVSTGVLTVPIGANNVRHTATFQSRTWLPMTISGIEWAGQYFNNSKRV